MGVILKRIKCNTIVVSANAAIEQHFVFCEISKMHYDSVRVIHDRNSFNWESAEADN